jgi:hypothetical protein
VETSKLLDVGADFRLSDPQLVELLKVQPKLRARAEPVAETYCGVGRNAALPVDDLSDTIQRRTFSIHRALRHEPEKARQSSRNRLIYRAFFLVAGVGFEPTTFRL